MIRKICGNPRCGKPFMADSGKRKYCSEECAKLIKKEQQRANERNRVRERPERFCTVCGKLIETTLYKFCSEECKNIAYERANVRYCIICGNTLGFGKHKYCSDKCKKSNTYIPRKKKKKLSNSIDDVLAKANAEGLSYGEYVSKYNI